MTDREFIKWLADNLSEKRSDVSEICNEFLETGKNPDIDRLEHRFIDARIPNSGGYEVGFDTLTTILSFKKISEAWEDCTDHKYYDDLEI